jgi:hypothetical protein
MFGGGVGLDVVDKTDTELMCLSVDCIETLGIM